MYSITSVKHRIYVEMFRIGGGVRRRERTHAGQRTHTLPPSPLIVTSSILTHVEFRHTYRCERSGRRQGRPPICKQWLSTRRHLLPRHLRLLGYIYPLWNWRVRLNPFGAERCRPPATTTTSRSVSMHTGGAPPTSAPEYTTASHSGIRERSL